MPSQPYTRRRTVIPHKLGLNNVTIAAATPVTSNEFSIDGHNQLTLEFVLTWVAATAVTAYVETSSDRGATWQRSQTKTIAAGVETLVPRSMSQAVGANESWKWEFGGINGEWARVVVGSTAGTTDTLKVTAQLGVV